MVFCNMYVLKKNKFGMCHNPYFNRWFSAIDKLINIVNEFKGHNPYFNRWFSAIVTVQ